MHTIKITLVESAWTLNVKLRLDVTQILKIVKYKKFNEENTSKVPFY